MNDETINECTNCKFKAEHGPYCKWWDREDMNELPPCQPELIEKNK